MWEFDWFKVDIDFIFYSQKLRPHEWNQGAQTLI